MSAPVSEARRARLQLADDARLGALIGFTLATIAVVLANTDVAAGENGGLGPMVIGIVLSGVTALAVGILVYSWTGRPARAALVLGVLGVLTVVAFWSGLPFVLGTHAVVLARRAHGRLATAAQVTGALAVLAAAAAVVVDRI